LEERLQNSKKNTKYIEKDGFDDWYQPCNAVGIEVEGN